MKCEIRKAGNITLFCIQGGIVFINLSEIRETLKGEILQSSNDKFLLDLGGVGMVDSAGIGFVVSVYKTILSRKGTFALVRPNDEMKSLFQTVGINRLINIYESEEEAIPAI